MWGCYFKRIKKQLLIFKKMEKENGKNQHFLGNLFGPEVTVGTQAVKLGTKDLASACPCFGTPPGLSTGSGFIDLNEPKARHMHQAWSDHAHFPKSQLSAFKSFLGHSATFPAPKPSPPHASGGAH